VEFDIVERNEKNIWYFKIKCSISLLRNMSMQHCIAGIYVIEKILISVSIIKFAMYMKTLQFLFTTCA